MVSTLIESEFIFFISFVGQFIYRCYGTFVTIPFCLILFRFVLFYLLYFVNVLFRPT